MEFIPAAGSVLEAANDLEAFAFVASVGAAGVCVAVALFVVASYCRRSKE